MKSNKLAKVKSQYAPPPADPVYHTHIRDQGRRWEQWREAAGPAAEDGAGGRRRGPVGQRSRQNWLEVAGQRTSGADGRL
jgi:hypothetical protein